jgi:hypothetical protein
MSLNKYSTDESCVVIFSPHSGVVPTSNLNHIFGRILESTDEKVIHITCSGQLQYWCPVMTSSKIDFTASKIEKKKICKSCTSISKLQFSLSKMLRIDMSQLISQNDLIETEHLVNEINETNWHKFTYKGLPLGIWSTYSTMIDYKAISPDSRSEIFTRYKLDLSSAVNSAKVGFKLSEMMKIKFALANSFEYPDSRAFLGALEKAHVRTFSFNNSGQLNLQENLIQLNPATKFTDPYSDERYNKGIHSPLSVVEIDLVEEHLKNIMVGNSTYSYSVRPSSQNFSSRMRLNDFNLNVLVLTSSPDEVEASKLAELRPESMIEDNDLRIFSETFELAQKNPKVNFIIRLHPRLVPNHRDSSTSYLIAQINEFKEISPRNVTWNVPEDSISLYNLFPLCDFVLTYRSSAALEALALGKKVFFIDQRKNPIRSKDFKAEINEPIENRFSKFLKDFDTENNNELVSSWRYWATHLLRTNYWILEKTYTHTILQARVSDRLGRSISSGRLQMNFSKRLSPNIKIFIDFLRRFPAFKNSMKLYRNSNSSSVDEYLNSLVGHYQAWGNPLNSSRELELVLIAARRLQEIPNN